MERPSHFEPNNPEEQNSEVSSDTDVSEVDDLTEVPVNQEHLERYRQAVEGERNNENIRETIDIYETPLLFRRDESLLTFLEFERRRGIQARGVSNAIIFDREQSSAPKDRVTYLEIPVPFPQTSDAYQYTIRRAERWNELDSSFDVEKTVDFFRKAYAIANSHPNSGRSNSSGETAEGSREFLHYLAEDPYVKKLWLASQKLSLTNPDNGRIYHLGLATQKSHALGGSFLISPEVLHECGVHSGQWHGDFMFEVLSTSRIPETKIQGYLEYSQEDGGNLIKGELYREVDGRFTELGYDRWSDPVYNVEHALRAGYKSKVAKALNMQLPQEEVDGRYYFTRQEEREILERVETEKGIYKKLSEAGLFEDTISEKYPTLDLDKLTMREIKVHIQSTTLNNLKQMFPNHKLDPDNLTTDLTNALESYIQDRFGLDINTSTKKDLIHAVVKKMGIPIYKPNGDQLWPQQLTHEQIAESHKTEPGDQA